MKWADDFESRLTKLCDKKFCDKSQNKLETSLPNCDKSYLEKEDGGLKNDFKDSDLKIGVDDHG